jgi:hypothetical protein
MLLELPDNLLYMIVHDYLADRDLVPLALLLSRKRLTWKEWNRARGRTIVGWAWGAAGRHNSVSLCRWLAEHRLYAYCDALRHENYGVTSRTLCIANAARCAASRAHMDVLCYIRDELMPAKGTARAAHVAKSIYMGAGCSGKLDVVTWAFENGWRVSEGAEQAVMRTSHDLCAPWIFFHIRALVLPPRPPRKRKRKRR